MWRLGLLLTIVAGCSMFAIYKDQPTINAVTSDREKVTTASLDKLLASGGNVNESYGGAQVLQYAMYNVEGAKKFEMVDYLISKGADVNAVAEYNAADYLLDKEKSAAAMQLKRLYHPANLTDGSLVSHVIQYKYYGIEAELQKWQELLKKNKFDPMVMTTKRQTPLHMAVQESLKEDRLNLMIPFLVANRADCNYKNLDGVSPKEMIKTKANTKLKDAFSKICK